MDIFVKMRQRNMIPTSTLLIICLAIIHQSQAKVNPFQSFATATTNSKPSSKQYFSVDTEDYDPGNSPAWTGLGRDFNLFGGRGGDSRTSSSSTSSSSYNVKEEGLKRRRTRPSSSSYGSMGGQYYGSGNQSNRVRSGGGVGSTNSNNPKSSSDPNLISSIRQWITSGNLPKLQCKVEPNTTLKVRKTFRPLGTLVRLGADFNTQLGVWQFKSSWEDRIIGGKLTLAGRELQFVKTWLLSVGAVEDLVTRLRLRAAVDLGTMKAYARLGFRTERLSPINVVEGFTLLKRLPLDGNKGHVKLEVKANFAFPEPEIEYSTENHRSFVGMGDIEVNIDELNLLLDY